MSWISHVALMTPLLKQQTHEAQFTHSDNKLYIKNNQLQKKSTVEPPLLSHDSLYEQFRLRTKILTKNCPGCRTITLLPNKQIISPGQKVITE